MPYITQDRRTEIDNGDKPKNAGELNYAMSILADDYIRTNGLSYQTISDIGSAFNYGSAEFYRIVAVPYESAKMAQNGTVYGPFKGPK